MAIKRRRATRNLQDLPGLFDDIDSSFKAPDPRKSDSASPSLTALTVKPRSANKKLQFISFGSGSSGNSCYIGIVGEGGVIIDAGVEADKVFIELRRNCIPIEKIAGILLTHDHSDHTRFAYSLLKKLPKLLLYATPRTISGLLTRSRLSRRIREFHKPIYKEFPFQAGPFMITAFDVSHDGSDNAGFCLTAYDHNFVIATDMGYVNERTDYYVKLANFLMIESNYDAAMLAAGSYPEHLKARIRGEKGHLNNTVTAAYLSQVWKSHLTDIFLCHLSHDNNRPEIALRVVTEAMTSKGIKVGDGSEQIEMRDAQVQVSVLPRFDSSPLRIFNL